MRIQTPFLAALVLLACSPRVTNSASPEHSTPVKPPELAVPEQPNTPDTKPAPSPPPTAAATPSAPTDADDEEAPSIQPGSARRADDSHCRLHGDKVPDGHWYGAVRSADAQFVSFDVKCWFEGEQANLAAAEDGVAEIPVPNDYYVRNRSTRVRKIPIDPAARAQWLPNPGNPELSEGPYIGWLKVRDKRSDNGGSNVNIVVEHGTLTHVAERYTP